MLLWLQIPSLVWRLLKYVYLAMFDVDVYFTEKCRPSHENLFMSKIILQNLLDWVDFLPGFAKKLWLPKNEYQTTFGWKLPNSKKGAPNEVTPSCPVSKKQARKSTSSRSAANDTRLLVRERDSDSISSQHKIPRESVVLRIKKSWRHTRFGSNIAAERQSI